LSKSETLPFLLFLLPRFSDEAKCNGDNSRNSHCADDEASQKEEILRELLKRLAVPNYAQALQLIMEREKAGPTLIGETIAIPHARLPGLKGLQIALGVVAGGPIRVWLLFLSPAEDAKLHLTFLASLAALFQNPRHTEELLKLDSAPAVLDYIRQSEIPMK
jgi:PTS system nitrogen regulatory IIA component